MIDKHEADGTLSAEDMDVFVTEALKTFRWHDRAEVSHNTYRDLLGAHPLVADVVAFGGPHINHLTPRTLDIDAVQTLMPQAGVSPKAVVEGPPPRTCPILLRQTSFKALEEHITFPDRTTTHSARFGEVEQRGQALTPKGRGRYDAALSTARADVSPAPDGSNAAAYKAALERAFADFPDDETQIRREGLGYFRYSMIDGPSIDASRENELDRAIMEGRVRADPIVYEDFLPVSAAGIFRSNLQDGGSVEACAEPGQADFEAALGARVLDPFEHYSRIETVSIEALGHPTRALA